MRMRLAKAAAKTNVETRAVIGNDNDEEERILFDIARSEGILLEDDVWRRDINLDDLNNVGSTLTRWKVYNAMTSWATVSILDLQKVATITTAARRPSMTRENI